MKMRRSKSIITEQQFYDLQTELEDFMELEFGAKEVQEALSNEGNWQFEDEEGLFKDGVVLFQKRRGTSESPVGITFNFNIKIDAGGWKDIMIDGEYESVTNNAKAKLSIIDATLMLDGAYSHNLTADVDLEGTDSKEIIKLNTEMAEGGFRAWMISGVVNAAQRVLNAARNEVARNANQISLSYGADKLHNEFDRIFHILYNGDPKKMPEGPLKDAYRRIMRAYDLFGED